MQAGARIDGVILTRQKELLQGPLLLQPNLIILSLTANGKQIACLGGCTCSSKG